MLQANNTQPFIEFRDASVGPQYTITLLDCLNAVNKAYNSGFFDFDSFDFIEYEHYEASVISILIKLPLHVNFVSASGKRRLELDRTWQVYRFLWTT